MTLLQYVIPVFTDSGPISPEGIKTLHGILVLLNIIFVFTLTHSIYKWFKTDRQESDSNTLLEYIFMDSPSGFIINGTIGIIDLFVLLIWLGRYIGDFLF